MITHFAPRGIRAPRPNPAKLPRMSAATIRDYLKEITAIQRGGEFTEHSFRSALLKLLQQLLPDVDTTNEPGRVMPGGAPDYVLKRDQIPLGYIEAKNIDKSLDDKLFSEQFNRYLQSLDNLVFTNYLQFRFHRDGDTKPVAQVAIAKLSGGKIKLLPDNFARFADLVTDFGAYQGQTITTADDLAARMADKARLLAGVIEEALHAPDEAAENRSLSAQLRTFKRYLIADINERRFAGMYAQTIAYGLFVARLHDDMPGDFSRRKAAELIPSTNPFLAKFFTYIAALDLDARIRWIVDDLADIFRAVDVDEVMRDFGKATQRIDPFLHFYETFLGAYDSKLRKGRGVYYTPAPAVNFIVRAVDSILKTEFGLKGGLADTAKTTVTAAGKKKRAHKVQLLDPATGTGTFLAEVVKFIRADFAQLKGAWPGYVKNDLIPRLNGFEILMAPYAMAHLKLEMTLRDTGCELNGEQLRIFLTNSLEEHHPDSDTLFAQWLADESREANRVKREAPLFVVFGNPPYSVSSHNTGAWIENLTADYKTDLQERNIQPLSDDYVKFIRYGEYLVEKNGEGVLAYISNNSFIDGLIHRRMRARLLETFDKIYILDLHGDARKKERAPDGSKDRNVFDIQQGVSINIFVKTGKKKSGAMAEVFHFDLFGARQAKYEFLWGHALGKVKFNKLKPRAPYLFFVPKDFTAQAEYDAGFPAHALFDDFNSGIKTHKDQLVIAFTEEDALQVKYDLQTLSVEAVQEKYRFPSGSESKIISAKRDVAQNDPETVPILYRPFDVRRTLYTGNSSGLMEAPRHKTMRHMLAGDNLALMTVRQQSTFPFQHVLVTDNIADCCAVSLQTREWGYFFPLYLYPDEAQSRLDDEPSRKPNLDADIVDAIPYQQPGDNTVTSVQFDNGRVFINKTQYFGDVPKAAWEFYVGGYQPAQKYLKDRKGRVLTWDEIARYQKIIIALNESAEVMQKIDAAARV